MDGDDRLFAARRIQQMMRDAEADIARLMPEALAKGNDVAFIVTDPRAHAADNPEARATVDELIDRAGGRPLVALLPTSDLFEFCSGGGPDLEASGRDLLAERRPGEVPVLLWDGDWCGVLCVGAGEGPPRAVEPLKVRSSSVTSKRRTPRSNRRSRG